MTGSPLDLPGRIVVVDDDPTVADVVERYLVRDGHSVQSVRDGYEALRADRRAPARPGGARPDAARHRRP